MDSQKAKTWDDFQSHLIKIIQSVKDENQASTKELTLEELLVIHTVIRGLLRSLSDSTTVLSQTRKKYGNAISNARKLKGKGKVSQARDSQAATILSLQKQVDELTRDIVRGAISEEEDK
jgi:hypothetical protein